MIKAKNFLKSNNIQNVYLLGNKTNVFKYLYESEKKNILSIGLVFSFQKTKYVPTNKYDKKLNYYLKKIIMWSM